MPILKILLIKYYIIFVLKQTKIKKFHEGKNDLLLFLIRVILIKISIKFNMLKPS